MKKIYHILLFLVVALFFFSACNDEWKEEQYEHYVSFKAPLNDLGVTQIYVSYKADEVSNYKLPVVVSGSTLNQQDMTVNIALDPDTLEVLNYERFQNRTDLYYEQLRDTFFTMPSTVDIKAGEDVALLNIDFNFKNIDLADKWILPLTIVPDTENQAYTPHPRKHYKKALLRVMPFNDYSGTYGAANLKTYIKGSENGAPIVKSNIQLYVVDDHTVFFYAGMVDENRMDRHNYKVYAELDEETNEVRLFSDNPDMIFESYSTPTFTVDEQMDVTRPYLLKRTIIIEGIDFSFRDYSTSDVVDFDFTVRGQIAMERRINTQIPDEDQAIEW